MCKVCTRQQQLAFLAKKQRWAAAVYFFTGKVLPPVSLPRFQSSSLTITSRTLFVCQQNTHRS